MFDIKPNSLQRFTGMFDKNSKMIYENDDFKFVFNNTNDVFIGCFVYNINKMRWDIQYQAGWEEEHKRVTNIERIEILNLKKVI